MRVDIKPIINRAKLDMSVLTSISEDSAHEDSNVAVCTCSNKCQLFEKIPPTEGIMVLMNEPVLDDEDQSQAGVLNCTCLKIQPQIDGSLADVHPNIYIPASLLDYPEHIVKYGGGGSGVTVFGGYHPQLGKLVMKHGGHKDLLELVSLYKIERELGIRGKSHLNELNQAYNKSHSNNSESEPVRERKNRKTAMGKMISKIGSRPVLLRIGGMFSKRGGSAPDLTSSLAKDKMMSTSTSAEGLARMQKHRPEFENKDEYYARLAEIENAMNDMKQRIPSFRMVYISPMHLRERMAELKNNTFRTSMLGNLNAAFDGVNARATRVMPKLGDEKTDSFRVSLQKQGRSICLFGSTRADSSSIRTHKQHVDLCFGGSYRLWKGAATEAKESNGMADSSHSCSTEPENDDNDGYNSLLAFVNQLYHHMEFNNWKVTLAQQAIGASLEDPTKSAPTASYLLAKGKLCGPLLDKLLDEEIRVIRDLQLLTLPNEVNVLSGIRLEYESLKARMESSTGDDDKVTAADVSGPANSFVGKAIHKNFHPETGRFVLLRQFGIDLKEGLIHLKPAEVMPAKHLEKILNDCFEPNENEHMNIVYNHHARSKRRSSMRKSSLEDTFDLSFLLDDTPDEEDPRMGNPLYIHGLDQWLTLLELATGIKNPNATSRIWTCGLTDGGLHNLFLGEDQIWMFDLGEPQLETIPGFLTKFLMSFFHTLGMEEDENGDWVVRFVQDSNRLRLTKATQELLPKVFTAFNKAVDRLLKELFDGDEEVRLLLLRYVMTQLVSDASFCIEKWRIKGGGDEQRSEHQYFLEKWLWRALWDVYVCEEVRRRYMRRQSMVRQDELRSFDEFLS